MVIWSCCVVLIACGLSVAYPQSGVTSYSSGGGEGGGQVTGRPVALTQQQYNALFASLNNGDTTGQPQGQVRYVQQRAQPVRVKLQRVPLGGRAGGLLDEQSLVGTDEEVDPNPQYSFSFDVKDDENTNYHNRQEVRDGRVIHGSYSVVDSDGYVRTVKYTADPVHGFKADVVREPTDIVVKMPTPKPEYQEQGRIALPSTLKFAPIQREKVSNFNSYVTIPSARAPEYTVNTLRLSSPPKQRVQGGVGSQGAIAQRVNQLGQYAISSPSHYQIRPVQRVLSVTPATPTAQPQPQMQQILLPRRQSVFHLSPSPVIQSPALSSPAVVSAAAAVPLLSSPLLSSRGQSQSVRTPTHSYSANEHTITGDAKYGTQLTRVKLSDVRLSGGGSAATPGAFSLFRPYTSSSDISEVMARALAAF